MAPRQAGSPVIVAERLAAAYGSRLIWQDASFTVDPGEFVAVLGPNGSGKSTLLRLLLGLLAPAAGSLQVLGKRPHKGNADIGYVPQRRSIDRDLPVRGRDFVHLGIDGGRWGVAMGNAATNDQRLDEPLASLDLRNQIVIAELVADLARANHLTVLLIAHDINPLLPIVDRVLYVAHGGVAIGKPAEVITTEQLSRLYAAPVEVLHDSHGHMFVVGLEAESAHHDA